MIIKKKLIQITILVLCVLIASCQSRSRAITPTSIPTQQIFPTLVPIEAIDLAEIQNTPSTEEEILVTAQTVTSDPDVTSFGWFPDGKIYYTIGWDPRFNSYKLITDIDESIWYSFDPATQRTKKLENPYTKSKNEFSPFLVTGETDQVFDITISPTGDTVIYTRPPSGYERPENITTHYFDPAEIWVLDIKENKSYPIMDAPEELYNCGIHLSIDASWFSDETIAIGSCYFGYEIIRIYFLMDLSKKSIQFLNFRFNDSYIPSEEIAVANNFPSLAFYSEGMLWLTSYNPKQGMIPLDLTDVNILFSNRPVFTPIWGTNDQAIYYWSSGAPVTSKENELIKYRPWWLEKVNVLTKEVEVILTESDLRGLMGDEMYNIRYASGTQWKLSDDEKSMLLYRGETYNSPAALLLISWQ